MHLHTQENALWTSPEWSGPVQNLDNMSGHAIQIFWSGPRCTSIWTGSGPNLDQIWTKPGIKQNPSGLILAATHSQVETIVELILAARSSRKQQVLNPHANGSENCSDFTAFSFDSNWILPCCFETAQSPQLDYPDPSLPCPNLSAQHGPPLPPHKPCRCLQISSVHSSSLILLPTAYCQLPVFT